MAPIEDVVRRGASGAARSLALAAVLLAGACNDAPVAPAPAPASSTAPTPDATPRRIVAFTCGAVDILTALGELDRVIAVEEDCPAPGTEKKIKIRNDDHPGQVNVPQVEAILALHPDLVIAKADLKESLGNRGLGVLWSPPVVDMASIPAFVDEIAAALGMPERGRALLEHMRAKESEVRALTAPLPKVRVYYENNGVGRTVGRGHIMDAMIRLAGGTNLVPDDPRPYVNVNPEAIFAFDPEVIVLGPFAESPEAVCARPGWVRLAAVRDGRVHKVPEPQRYLTLGTPRCVDGCSELLVPWLHPALPRPDGKR